ncbi:DMT family transporter, partial [Roseobacter sp.]|uniref:DMT family transporter n=1 Tax=Roseobacter sp. TaxID=1907202 RepID=UPI0032987AF0
MPERIGPIGLLLWCGFLLGVGFPLSKLSSAAGVPPMVWAVLVSAGASLPLIPVLVSRGVMVLPRGRMLRYVLLSGAVTFALINLMIFELVPRIGAGQVGMMFALSPVATLAVSAMFGLKIPGRLGLLGIGIGLIGALMVAFGRGGVEGGLIWSLVALLIPVVLAMGNVYRKLDWPEGADPMVLAFWSHVVAMGALVVAMLTTGQSVPLVTLREAPVISVVQAVAAGLTFPAYFRLQKLGGPVLL